MGVLNINETNQELTYANAPIPFAQLFLHAAGSDVMVPVFRDIDLTEMRANPIVADASGIFDIIYLINGSYRIIVRNKDGDVLFDVDNIAIKDGFDTGVISSFAQVSDILASQTLSYDTGGGVQTVLPGECLYVTTGDYTYEVADAAATDYDLETAGGVRLLVKDKEGTLYLAAFGADMGGNTDCAPQFLAALNAARRLNALGNHGLDGASTASNPRVVLDLGAGICRFDSNVEFDNIGAIEIAGRAAVITGVFADYLLRLTGRCLNVVFRGIVFESTQVGCVAFDADNIASARAQFIDCRFATDPDDHDSSIGVLYYNRSSTLSFERCYFNRIKHPMHVTSCDFISVYDCWFGFPSFAAFADQDGYIRCEKGFLDINRCLFAGGPSWYSTKKNRDGSPMTEYTEVAYIKMGVPASVIANDPPDVPVVTPPYTWHLSANGINEYYMQAASGGDPVFDEPINMNEAGQWINKGILGALVSGEWSYGDNDGLGYNTIYVRLSDDLDPDDKPDGFLLVNQGAHAVDNGRLSISDTRIGYEVGAGPLVNWFIANKGAVDQDFRGGIVLRNIQTSPREEKELAVDGVTPVAPLVRLFEMPHQLVFDGVHGNSGHLGLIAPGSTTSLDALRTLAHAPVDYKSDFSSQVNPDSFAAYAIRDVTALNLHMTVSPTSPSATENARWMELFGAYDYFFPSDFTADTSAGNSTLVTVRTFFSDFSGDRRGCLFEVAGGARGSIANDNNGELPIFGYIAVTRDETTADTLFVRFQSAVDTSDTNPEIQITAKFDVAGTTSTSIATTDAANATLVLELQHENNPGVGNVRCAGLVVKPVAARFRREYGNRLVQAYI